MSFHTLPAMRRRTSAAVVLLVVALGACGGSDEPSTPSATVAAPSTTTTALTTSTTAKPSTPEEEVEAAYLESWDVYADAARSLVDFESAERTPRTPFDRARRRWRDFACGRRHLLGSRWNKPARCACVG